MRSVKVASKSVLRLRIPIKPAISLGSVIESLGTFHCRQGVNPTFQTSGLADLKGNGNSRLLGATGHRKKAIPKAKPQTTENVEERLYMQAEP